jgi:hypothetical protein
MSEPWLKSDTDKMLDLYFSGASPSVISNQMNRDSIEIKYRLNSFLINRNDRVAKYQPIRRTSRIGKPWTKNELLFKQSAIKHAISTKNAAKVLCRAPNELLAEPDNSAKQVNLGKQLAPTMDLIWAYRYAYFVWGKEESGIVSDLTYDDLVKEEIEFGGGGNAFEIIKAHRGWPDYVISLALYLSAKAKWEPKQIIKS